jgi:hypothetical protein
MSSETDLSRNQAIQNQRNSFSRGFPLPFNVKTLQAFGALFQIPQYSAFFLTVAIGNCMVKFIPPVNFCSDENIQTIFGTKLEDFLNYRIDNNSIS